MDIKYIDNNEKTQKVEDAFSNFNFDYRDIPGKEYIKSLNTVATFLEYTQKYAKKIGYDGNDLDSLAKYIFDKGIKNNAPLSSLTTVKNWLKKAPPASNPAGRENVYRFCFALEMDAKETKEFFLKAYLERPFNYKNIHEAVYFFCMNNGLKYTDAERIIEKIEAIPFIENKDAEVLTEKIGSDISKKKTEDDVVKYLSENRSSFTSQNQTSREKIQDLLDKCIRLVNENSDILNEGNIPVNNMETLLHVITDYKARKIQDGKKVNEKSISRSNLPKIIKKNFPSWQLYQRIKKQEASFDVIRKTLILLNFYHYFADALINNAENLEHGLFDEFVDETDILLNDCGYIQLYWRNPYDWIFGYCAWAPNPLDEFKNIIDEFYLNDSEIY